MIGWGILGNATVARLAVLPAIERSANGTVVAIGSRAPARAEELTTRHGGIAVAGYEAVLARSDVAAVYIPLPNHLHREWAIRALQAGKHVLVEKPLAMNAAEAREMVAAAEAAGCFLMEAFMWRFHPRAQRIYELVRSGALGNIGSIRAAFTFPVQPDANNKRLFSAAMGGGSLWDVGSYGVSLARWMLGEEPESVTAQAVWNDEGVDVNFAGTLRFASGTLAVVESGFQSALQQTFSILGDRGAVEFARHDAFIPGEKDAEFTWRRYDAEQGEVIEVAGADQYQRMVEHFGAVVAGEAAPLVPPSDGIRQMETLDALAAAARRGETVRLAAGAP